MVPAGDIPLVAVSKEKMLSNNIPEHLRIQGERYGRSIKLCKFKFVEVIMEVGEGKDKL